MEDPGFQMRHNSPVGAAEGCDLLILIFQIWGCRRSRSKDRSLRQLLHRVLRLDVEQLQTLADRGLDAGLIQPTLSQHLRRLGVFDVDVRQAQMQH
ncbi:hypothetical protein D3C72_1255540 [compost metagenome]